MHDLLYKSRARQVQEFNYGESAVHATCLLVCSPKQNNLYTPCTVPKAFREALLGAGWTVGRSPVHHAVTASDGTTKVLLFPCALPRALTAAVLLRSPLLYSSLQILLKLEDNRLIETVGIPVDDDNKGSSRLTACVSSQVRPGHYYSKHPSLGFIFTLCNVLCTGRLPLALLILCHGQGRLC